MTLTNELIRKKAKELGFDLVGFTKAEVLYQEADRLEQWLTLGYHSGMDYMERNVSIRKDILEIFPETKSVISLGINYYQKGEYSPGKAKVSRYAWGKDYHLIIWEKLDQFLKILTETDPGFSAKSFVDTGPVMDKAWAARAGLGWIGKHTNIINPEYGSWIFLATILTNYEFEYSSLINDFCGTCTRCIDACPTGAITDSYVLNAGKCISYLTIENKQEISAEFEGKLDNWVFGCDICQDVCPWNNKFAQENGHPEFSEKTNVEFELEELINLNEQDFRNKFRHSPLKRAKLNGIKRNAEFLKKNLHIIDKSELENGR